MTKARHVFNKLAHNKQAGSAAGKYIGEGLQWLGKKVKAWSGSSPKKQTVGATTSESQETADFLRNKFNIKSPGLDMKSKIVDKGKNMGAKAVNTGKKIVTAPINHPKTTATIGAGAGTWVGVDQLNKYRKRSTIQANREAIKRLRENANKSFATPESTSR